MAPASGRSSLEARVAALEERQRILGVLRAYSHAIDRGDRTAWLDCFTADGVFDVRSQLPGYPAQRRAGREALREFIEAHSAPPEAYHKHLFMLSELDVRGTVATSMAYFVHLVDRDGRPLLQSYGSYLDRLTKEEDGRWRIVERVAEVEAWVDPAGP